MFACATTGLKGKGKNMSRKEVLLGVVPTRRDLSGEFFCNSNVALERKRQVEAKLSQMGIAYINIDFLNEEGIIRNGLDAEKTAAYLREKGVDALFMPHLNFGCEDAVAKVGKLLNKPLLLWGPRDGAPDAAGNRCTDSQCGLFATGKVLNQFGVPFTYMTNCRVEDEVFDRVLNNFLAASLVVKSFYGMRIGQFGVRPETFWSVKCNERQLLERFGIEVVPITMLEVEAMYKEAISNREVLKERVRYYKDNFDVRIEEEYLYRTAAMYTAISHWAKEYKIDGIASSCWEPMRQIAGISSCFTFAELTDAGLPVACEMDIHGAISSCMAQAASGWKQTSFLADITARHPDNDNAELFWHCGNFPRSVAGKDHKAAISASFDEGRPSVGKFELDKGTVTICRFDGSADDYQLLSARGKVVEGPVTTGTYGWIEFEDWPAIEHRVVTGPYIHHCAGIYADIAPVLYEACRYIPGLHADPMQPDAAQIEKFLK
ncbi:fucose isomerase [Lachnospiraceae bacterium]|nr:fucose isomerase [Lachnospiraceae bacterium]